MSIVNCRHCNAPNPSGSRFCNGCGAAMPPGTNLICPNCQSTNPQHLLYCDNCGTRLVQDEWPAEDSPPEATPRQAFSLPERQPGDTGDLDPTFIPDWLKTGESAIPDTGEGNVIGDWLSQLAAQEESADDTEAERRGERPSWLDSVQGDLDDDDEPTPVEADSQADLLAQADIPDWLADLSALQAEEEKDSPEDAPLPDWMSQVDSGVHAATESEGELTVPEWLRSNFDEDNAPVQPEPPPSSESDHVLDADELTEWFDAVATDEPPSAEAKAEVENTPPDDEPSDEEVPAAEAGDSSWLEALSEEADEPTVPEAAPYEGDLAALINDPSPIEEPDIAPGTMPDWLAEMRPDALPAQDDVEDDFEALFAEMTEEESAALADTKDEIAGDLPDYVAEGEVPTWLEEASSVEMHVPTEEEDLPPAQVSYDELPEWLRPEESAPSFDDALSAALDAEEETGRPGTGSIIFEDDLVPDPNERIARPAEIPDWLEALRPGEEEEIEKRDEAAMLPLIPDDAPVEMAGPLAGLKGVVPIEAVIAQPHPAHAVRRLEVSPDQARQMALLRQLLSDEPRRKTTVEPQRALTLALPSRALLSLLLVAALLVGLFLPSLLSLGNLFLPPAAQAAHQAIDDVAGRPVLVVYDFAPGMSGELIPLAEALAAEAAANNSPLMLLTQEPTAVGLYAPAAARYGAQVIGYVPGNALGLRQISSCLSGTDCTTLVGRPLAANMAEIALIIVVTGDRDHLVDWIEQVGANGDTPLIAAVTQSLGPTAAPYVGSGQLSALVEGMPALVAYQQNYTGGSDALDLLRAQSTGQWTAALLLLVGALWYGVLGRAPRRRQRA